ncbi:hypothetical protein, partial [Pseudomonas sp. GW531-R1]|uniref:hypothetical protein n=1 Tax=Pseudomonas sp. GW531-R1 TaxID=2075556 RepID=UPI000CD3A9CA
VLAVAKPFSARFLRFRHHNGGEIVNQISLPSTVSVYENASTANWNLPRTGENLASGKISQNITPRSFAALDLSSKVALTPGAYLLA